MEAHGGYAFCGMAALTLLGHERLCDIDALLVRYEQGMLMIKVAFSSNSCVIVEQPIRSERVVYKHHWEFPISEKTIPMLRCPIIVREDSYNKAS